MWNWLIFLSFRIDIMNMIRFILMRSDFDRFDSIRLKLGLFDLCHSIIYSNWNRSIWLDTFVQFARAFTKIPFDQLKLSRKYENICEASALSLPSKRDDKNSETYVDLLCSGRISYLTNKIGFQRVSQASVANFYWQTRNITRFKRR